ncbi:MAG: AgmX/PglI C-terminal domain-containing protein [Polyangiaceae bacterium]|nr:AgmX/PglI C-terminal domain-containing protein [Polyangiaceae bacterium]
MSKSGVPDWFGKDDPPPEPPRRSGSKAAPLAAALVMLVAGAGAGVWMTLRVPVQAEVAAATEPDPQPAAPPEPLLEEERAVPELEAIPPSALDTDADAVAAAEGDATTEDENPGERAERDSASVLRVVQSLRAETRRCYARELPKQPDARGRVDATFTIERSGRVSKVTTSQSATLPPAVSACVAGVLRQARFEPAGDTATVKMPFVFQAQ